MTDATTPVDEATPVAEKLSPEQEALAKASEVLDGLDDVRVADKEGFTSALSSLLALGKRLTTEYKRYTNAAKEVAAARVAIRPFMVLPTGFPDWAGQSNGYKAAVEQAEFSLYVSLGPDGKRRLDQAVRQHVRRSYLLPGIVGYVLAHTNGLADEYARWVGDTDNGVTPDQDAILTGPSDALIHEVRKHYNAAGLNLPDGPFAEKVADVPSGGPGAGDPPSAIAALDVGLGGLSQIVPDIGVNGLMRATSDVSVRLIEAKGSELKNRPGIVANLQRIAEIASLTAKLVNGDDPEHSDRDEARLVSLYWTKEDAPKLD